MLTPTRCFKPHEYVENIEDVRNDSSILVEAVRQPGSSDWSFGSGFRLSTVVGHQCSAPLSQGVPWLFGAEWVKDARRMPHQR